MFSGRQARQPLVPKSDKPIIESLPTDRNTSEPFLQNLMPGRFPIGTADWLEQPTRNSTGPSGF